MGTAPSHKKASHATAKTQTSWVWEVVGSLASAFFWGWLIVSGLFFYRWVESGYEEAAAQSLSALDVHITQVGAVLGTEDASIQKEVSDLSTAISHFFSGMNMRAIEAQADKTSKAGEQWLGEMNQAQTKEDAGLKIQSQRLKSSLQTFWQGIVETAFFVGMAGVVMLLNLVVLLLAVPLFLLGSLVGLSDGLMHRAIRRAGLGRESAYVFHKLVHFFPKALGAGVLVFLLMPTPAHGLYILWGLALGVGLWFSHTVSRFKKYL